MAEVVHNPYSAAAEVAVAYTDTPTRLAFLRKVYALFSGAVIVWAGTALLVMSNEGLMRWTTGLFTGFLGFLLFMALAFFLLRVTAGRYPLNIIGLGIFGVLEGFFSAPLIYFALARAAPAGTQFGEVLASGTGLLTQAFGLTAIVFGGLSAYAITTKRDFSFLRAGLWIGFSLLLGLGILSIFGVGGGFVLGWGWSAAWVLLMSGFVLYDTQNIMKRFPANAAASAAAILLLDFVILFKHILLLLSRRD
ncbi:MAG: Bax inhibitor-1 family protein [Planctomycetota bacterium]|nr:Bax inhibitor-1 family protein [Planctomycetota bacterium]